jgi:hypothetical protein
MESLLDLLPIPPASGSWQALALDVSLRATLALAASALAVAALRRASASVRHLVWASALAGALALPFLMLALPYWHVPILPQAKPAPRLTIRDPPAEGIPASLAPETLPRVASGGPAMGPRAIDPRRPAVAPVVRRAATPTHADRSSAPVFLLGRPVQAGLHGPYPDLAHLKDGDPVHAIDFRRVYATVLERWLKLPAEASLGEPFEPLPLFRS